MTTKFLAALGLVLLLAIPLCVAESEEEEAPDSTEDSPEKSEEQTDDEDEGRRENDNVPRGPFVASTGTEKNCHQHPDCYDQREPSDWCLLGPDEKWTNRGCFCSSKGKCTIERRKGDGFQHTNCSPREGWTCKYD